MNVTQFTIRVVGPQVWDPSLDNIDVEVVMADGRRYGATFFTLRNIERLFDKNRETGECQSGLYLWAANMILVRELSFDVIHRTVDDLIASGEFEQSFGWLGERPVSGDQADPSRDDLQHTDPGNLR